MRNDRSFLAITVNALRISSRHLPVAAMMAVLLVCFDAQVSRSQDLSASIRVGTLGPGLEMTGALSPRFNARLGASAFSYERQDRIDDLKAVLSAGSDATVGAANLLVDYFPVGRGIRLTTGFHYNFNQLDTFILPSQPFSLGDKQLSPEQLGSLRVSVSHKASLNPYAGIGFGNSVRSGKRLGIVVDIGVMYTDSPFVEVSATGLMSPTVQEVEELEERFEGVQFYPLVSVGISFKFLGDN